MLQHPDGTVFHKRCFKCGECKKIMDPNDKSTRTLLRSKIEALIKGEFACEECKFGLLGSYNGKGDTDNGGTVAWSIRLMEERRCWLDCVNTTKIASGTWHVEGFFKKEHRDDGTTCAVTFTVDRRPGGAGPEMGRTFEFSVCKDSGDDHRLLVCEGVRCKFQPFVPEEHVPKKEAIVPEAQVPK